MSDEQKTDDELKVFVFDVGYSVFADVRVKARDEAEALELLYENGYDLDHVNWTTDKMRDWSINLCSTDDNVDDYDVAEEPDEDE